MTMADPPKVLAELWRAAGHSEAALDAVTLDGTEPVLPSSFAVGTAAQATVAASALAAGELWRLRTGRRQAVRVDMRNAGIEFRSERYLLIDGKPPPEHRDKTVGLYRCGDGPLGAAAYEFAAPSRRYAKALECRIRTRLGAARARALAGF
jgi:hypothetical protein